MKFCVCIMDLLIAFYNASNAKRDYNDGKKDDAIIGYLLALVLFVMAVLVIVV